MLHCHSPFGGPRCLHVALQLSYGCHVFLVLVIPGVDYGILVASLPAKPLVFRLQGPLGRLRLYIMTHDVLIIPGVDYEILVASLPTKPLVAHLQGPLGRFRTQLWRSIIAHGPIGFASIRCDHIGAISRHLLLPLLFAGRLFPQVHPWGLHNRVLVARRHVKRIGLPA